MGKGIFEGCKLLAALPSTRSSPVEPQHRKRVGNGAEWVGNGAEWVGNGGFRTQTTGGGRGAVRGAQGRGAGGGSW